MRSRLPIFAVATCALAAAYADRALGQSPDELWGRPVVRIELAGEAAPLLSPREVGIPLGTTLGRSMLRSAAERLVASGRWADVQLRARAEGTGVVVVATLVPRVVLAFVSFDGNDRFDDDALLRVLGLATDQAFDPESIPELLAHIHEHYETAGYEGAQAQLHLRDTDDPSVKVLVVSIREGEPTRIERVVVDGELLPRRVGIRRLLDIDEGDVLNLEALEETVRKAEGELRRAGWYEAALGPIAIRRDTGQPSTVTVHLPSRLGPRYRVEVGGDGPIDRDDVVESLGLGVDRLDEGALQAMRRKAQDHCLRQGFPDARAHLRTFRSPDRYADRPTDAVLLVELVLGPRLDVDAIRFPGARHFDQALLLEQVESFLADAMTREGFADPVDRVVADLLVARPDPEPRIAPRPDRFDPRRIHYPPAYERAIEHIRELYDGAGYLGVQVGPARLTRPSPGHGVVEIPVVEGPQTLLHAVELRDQRALTSREILEAGELVRGAPFSRMALDRAEERIVDLYRERGFYYARVDTEVRFSDDRTRALVVLHLVEGFEVYVGDVVVEGAERTDESLIRDLVRMRPGELFRPSLARQTQERLMELGIFSGVLVTPRDPDLPERTKTLVITVTERPTQLLDFRAGFSTAQGVRGGFEYGYRNLFGKALGFTLQVQLANQFFFLDDQLAERFGRLSLADRLERRISVSLALPYVPGLPRMRGSIGLSNLRENERAFGLDKTSVDVNETWRINRRVTIGIAQSLENNDVSLLVDDESYDDLIRNTTDPRLQRLLRVPEGKSTLIAAGVTTTLDGRDNAFNPRRGAFGSVTVEWARTLVSEQIDVGGGTGGRFFSHHIRAALTASGYVPVSSQVVLAVQIRAGRIFHLQDRSSTYPNRQFFLGGMDSLRGYRQDALIPQDVADAIAGGGVDPNAILQGGDAFLLLRSELRFPVYGDLQGGLFTDLGNLWRDATEMTPLRMRPTTGIGLRVNTPIGPLAFDYGVLVLRRRDLAEPFGAFHFSIGLF